MYTAVFSYVYEIKALGIKVLIKIDDHKNRDKNDAAMPAALGMMPGSKRVAAVPKPSTTLLSVDCFDSWSTFISPFRLSISLFIWSALPLNPSSNRIFCSCKTYTHTPLDIGPLNSVKYYIYYINAQTKYFWKTKQNKDVQEKH